MGTLASSGAVDKEQVYSWIQQLTHPDTREHALIELRSFAHGKFFRMKPRLYWCTSVTCDSPHHVCFLVCGVCLDEGVVWQIQIGWQGYTSDRLQE